MDPPSATERIELSVRRSGDRVVVKSRFSEDSWLGGGSMRPDLTAEVPARMTVDVDDGSGERVITGLASLRVDDGSGEIEISEIAGDVSIEDGSREIEVRRVGGTVRVTDGSGEIEIAHVGWLTGCCFRWYPGGRRAAASEVRWCFRVC